MLKNIKNRFSKVKKSKLESSAGEKVRDAVIKAGIKRQVMPPAIRQKNF